ncbi:MAG: DNA adenine methylase [Bdellovibrionales bacterium]
MTKVKSSPILRWPGGKTQLLDEIQRRMPSSFGCMHEPFIGGGALTFALQPLGGFLSDMNAELINFYTELKHRPESVIDHLRSFKMSEKFFYKLRAADRDKNFLSADRSWRAARYLFINRCCFNGMMRVNAAGQLNCSYGQPNSRASVFNEDDVYATNEALRVNRIYQAPYSSVEYCARPGDFVYLDPPYVPVRPGGEIGYTGNGFSLNDQGQLAVMCGRLTKKGVYWMLSNSSVNFIKILYGHYKIHEITARRSISGSANARGKTTELLVTNY